MSKSLKKIMSLLSLARCITGRKKFQKIVHILQQKGLDFGEHFRFHYYGPYSDDLQLKIDALVMENVINEERADSGRGYQYALKEDVTFDSDPDLERHCDFVNYLNSQSPQVLELVSSVYYILERKKNFSEKEAFLKARRLKPKLDNKTEEAQKVYRYIENLHVRA